MSLFVIPAEAGIQLYHLIIGCLDYSACLGPQSGVRWGDNFLRDCLYLIPLTITLSARIYKTPLGFTLTVPSSFSRQPISR